MAVPFEDALMLGMRTAAFVVEQRHGPRFAQVAYDYEAEFRRKVEDRRAGRREMIAADILLPMPLMTAADIGLGAEHHAQP
ncbi:MAG: hypothetical protein J7498_05590 [Sphingobium sp.]|nr:hypothetical protein [Sphingobium sp.]